MEHMAGLKGEWKTFMFGRNVHLNKCHLQEAGSKGLTA